MIYSPDIVDKILEELEKIPNIRYVCNKVGIDHSTFYRWMVDHLKFHKAVVSSIVIGREKMNDAAESVIITGLQNNEFRAAAYWLSHNSERYVGVDRIRYFQYLERYTLEFLRKIKDDNPLFDAMFEHYFTLENNLDPDIVQNEMDKLINALCHGNQKLIQTFKANYESWKKGRELPTG